MLTQPTLDKLRRMRLVAMAEALARADGSYQKLVTYLAKSEVLVLDEWGTAPFNPVECRELFEVIDDRNQKRSTIIASQLPLEAWHAVFGDPTIADAILDRLVHNAHKISLRGSPCGRY
jgi:DNA replication protein DnaC